MNLVKLQDELNNDQLEKEIKRISLHISIKNKILMDRLTEGGKRLYTENDHTRLQEARGTISRNHRPRHCECCSKVHAARGTLKIQFNSYQNLNDIFSEMGKNNPEIHMEAQSMPNSKNNLEKENNARGLNS